MRIAERECAVAGDGDGLGGRLDGFAPRLRQRLGQRGQGIQINRTRDMIGGKVEERFQICALFGLHQSQMARRGHDPCLTHHSAEDGNAHRLQRAAEHGFVARTADLVQDDAADTNVGREARETSDERRNRARHARRIDDEDDGQAEVLRQIRRGSAPIGWGAVEQAHRAFDQHQVIAPCEAFDPVGRHRPSVEVQARLACGGLVKAGVDIVGAGFAAAHGNALARQSPQDAECNRGFARTGGRSREDQTCGHALSAGLPRPSGSRLRGASPLAMPCQSST